MLAEASLLVALTVHHGPGAEACLSEAKLRRGVEKRLRRRVFAEPAQAQLRFSVTYTKRDRETEARVVVSGADGAPRGARTLVTESHCSALDDSLALSVALLVDQPPEPEVPQASPAPQASEPTAVAPPVPPRRAAPTPIAIPEEVVAPREPWHLAVGAGVQAEWGVQPEVGPGASLHLLITPHHFVPVVLSGEWFVARTAERDSASGARFRLMRVALSVCPPLWRAPERELALCVGQKVGWLRVDGFGFDHDLSERRLTYALHAGGAVRQQLFAPLSVRAYLGAEVPVVRDRFVSNGRDASDLFRPSPVGLVAELGLEVALW